MNLFVNLKADGFDRILQKFDLIHSLHGQARENSPANPFVPSPRPWEISIPSPCFGDGVHRYPFDWSGISRLHFLTFCIVNQFKVDVFVYTIQECFIPLCYRLCPCNVGVTNLLSGNNASLKIDSNASCSPRANETARFFGDYWAYSLNDSVASSRSFASMYRIVLMLDWLIFPIQFRFCHCKDVLPAAFVQLFLFLFCFEPVLCNQTKAYAPNKIFAIVPPFHVNWIKGRTDSRNQTPCVFARVLLFWAVYRWWIASEYFDRWWLLCLCSVDICAHPAGFDTPRQLAQTFPHLRIHVRIQGIITKSSSKRFNFSISKIVDDFLDPVSVS